MLQSIHYDMEDLLEQANEIQESLGRSYAVPDELDEADLEAGEHNRVSVLVQQLMLGLVPELDALQLEAEEEGPSYLADLNKAPDFIDEPPVEVAEVRLPFPAKCTPPDRPLRHQRRKLSRQAHSRCEDTGQNGRCITMLYGSDIHNRSTVSVHYLTDG